MNAECRRFVYEETERGRDWERIEQLEQERERMRSLLQRWIYVFAKEGISEEKPELLSVFDDTHNYFDD